MVRPTGSPRKTKKAGAKKVAPAGHNKEEAAKKKAVHHVSPKRSK